MEKVDEPSILNIKPKYKKGDKLFAHINKGKDDGGWLIPVVISEIRSVRFFSKSMYVITYETEKIVSGGIRRAVNIEEDSLYAKENINLFLTHGV